MNKSRQPIAFEAELYQLKDWVIFRLPPEASQQLPSRGQVAVEGTIDGEAFRSVLEPDGYWGHWWRVDDELLRTAKIAVGDTVRVEITPTKQWPEPPSLPAELASALAQAPQAVKDKWHDITPMARWEWIRWVNATANLDTRAVRIEKTISKLAGKHRRPCCFNLAACTEPYVAKSGRLIEP